MIVALIFAVLLIVANGAPVLARFLLKDRGAYPVDAGIVLGDGKRLFGNSKTWRGIIAALVCTALAALVFNQTLWVGILVALGAMLGDLFSSYCKRRLGLPPSTKKRGLDQLPEAFLPSLLVYLILDHNLVSLLLGGLLFAAFDVLISPWLYRLGVRKVPH